MKTKRKLVIGLVSVLGLGLAAGSALSASPFGPGFGPGENCPQAGGPGAGYGMMGGNGPRHGGPGMHQGQFQRGDMSARLGQIKDELKITEAQQPAWDKFVATMQQHQQLRSKHMQQRFGGGALEDVRLSAVERLDKRVEHMSDGLAQMQTLKAELNELYKVLDAEQQELVDRLAFMRHRGHRGF